ncbi:LacI family DNA-binding transcriptional regulator [Phaeovulum sp. W22_SRMD_FR3]|uniref:LacI family DNA-binding transcriptional regulator n=1 Tax=Phaeovulum sp. W22_SRMD_FR3 TaxID=3240274 RepID=UPI003F9B9C45
MDEPEFFETTSVTADDVAEAAGVSRWTVARAFKKDASISKKTRAKVMTAAEALGYVPDLHAAGLASDRSGLVALMLDDFSNPHKLVQLERLSRILRQEGWGVLLVNMLSEADASSAFLAASQRRVDAAVVIGTRFDDSILSTALGARRVKKLIVFARTSTNPNTITICCDDAVAMREIADHLYERGRRRPLFVAGPGGQSAVLKRKDSFAARWQELTGCVPPVMHVAQYDVFLAREAVVAELSDRARADLPDVLVCENDIVAIGALEALRFSLGLRVPEDIAVTGFDDIPLASLASHALTTYRQPITKMAEALVGVLEGNDKTEVILPGQFMPRQTT